MAAPMETLEEAASGSNCEKPYACLVPGCNKRYTDPSSLRKHFKNHNRDQQQKKRVIQQTCLQMQKNVTSGGKKIARDPELAAAQKEKDEARVQRSRAKPKTPEEPVGFRHRFEM